MLISKQRMTAVLLVSTVFFISTIANATENNIILLDSLFSESAKTVCSQINSEKVAAADLYISEHPSKALLLNKYLSDRNCSGIKYTIQDKQSITQKAALNLMIKDISLKYQLYSDSKDSIVRIIRVCYSSTLSRNDGTALALKDIDMAYRDIYPRKEAENLSLLNGGFAYPKPPEQKTSFLEDIAEPVIIISSAVITVFLLFTVRSN